MPKHQRQKGRARFYVVALPPLVLFPPNSCLSRQVFASLLSNLFLSFFPALLCIQGVRPCELHALFPFANWSTIRFNQVEVLAGGWGTEGREIPSFLSALGQGQLWEWLAISTRFTMSKNPILWTVNVPFALSPSSNQGCSYTLLLLISGLLQCSFCS